jgi:Subtilase family
LNGKTSLFVTLEDAEGRAVTGAALELRPADASGPSTILRFDEQERRFVSEEVDSGNYVLIVRADGYAEQEIPLRLAPPSFSTSVIVGREGQPYYMAAGRRMYFEPDGQRMAALMRQPEPTAAEASPLAAERVRAELETRPRTGLAIVVFERAELSELRVAPRMPAMAEMVDVGPVLKSPGADVRFLSRLIEVVAENGVTRERLEEVVRPFGVHVYSQDRLDPRMFRLESDDMPGPEYGALPERLMALPEVRYAASMISALDKDTALVPSDALFPLQFHALVTRCPEAWESVDAVKTAQSFGSADVIVAVSDQGIDTTTNAAGSVAIHSAFQGTVVGGALSARPGLTNRKLLEAFNFASSPMARGNDLINETHGSWVAGVICAVADASGVAGTAANTRLLSYIRVLATNADPSAYALAYYAGLVPGWARGGSYAIDEPFPFLLASGGNPVPGAGIVNASHLFLGSVSGLMARTLQRMTLFGRDRRGTLIVAAAGNNDTDLRREGRWAENTNVLRVAASTLDVREEEVRMNYSAFSVKDDPVIDVSAPSGTHNLPHDHEPPQLFTFISVALLDLPAGSGDLPTTAAAKADLTNSPAAGTRDLKSAGFASFAVNQKVIVSDKGKRLHSEVHDIASKPAADTIRLGRDLGYSYPAGAEAIALSGNKAYSSQFGGTSAATPQVTSIAALMLSVRPALSWLEVRELIRRTAVPINLRYRGSRYGAGATGGDHRYRWLDPGGANLIDADGLLDITGGNKTIVAGPVRKGDRVLALNDTDGIAPRQALLIGSETKLNKPHPKAAPHEQEIDVDRADEFEGGDTLFIGREAETVLISATAAPGLIYVQSVDGIEPGDDITIGTGPAAETVTVSTIEKMSATIPVATMDGDAETAIRFTSALANPHSRGATVKTATTQFEGPFTVTTKVGNTLTLDRAVTAAHPANRVVRKTGTETKAVIRVRSTKEVEIDPLRFDHPFNAAGLEHVRVGRIASYSLAFGRGRIDALEAVEAAKGYKHDERDLVIRNFLGDDGVSNRAAQEVESPDLWSRNDAPDTLGTLPSYTTAGPHQVPQITIDPAIHVGTGPNDLEVSGTCTSAAELTFVIEIDHAGAADTFKWSRNGVFAAAGVAITGAEQLLSEGVSVKFATATGHALNDRWIIGARQVINRFLHVRVRNRGKLPFFSKSTFAPAASPGKLDVARSRILLAVSDGYPVCRYASIAEIAGPDDVQPVSAYTGANPRALYTIEITATAAGGDTFRWYRDGTPKTPVVLTASTLEQTLDDGVKVRFGSATGHEVGDRWNLYTRSGADAFLNVDHYWDVDLDHTFDLFPDVIPPDPVNAPPGFDPVSGLAGTRSMHFAPISGLGAGLHVDDGVQIDSVPWPEALRLPTNNPNEPKSTHRRRLFILGEAVPHDGAAAGFTPKSNNNISFRELVLAKYRFAGTNGLDPAEAHVDVDKVGLPKTKFVRVEVRTTAGTFTAERVRLKWTARVTGGLEEVRFFRFAAGSWDWDQPIPWATLSAPLEARRTDGSEVAATDEQFDIHFDCNYTVDSTFTDIFIEPQILSAFRDFPVATGMHHVMIYTIEPLPTGTDAAVKAAAIQPASFVFADVGSLTQTDQQAFGPVDGSPTTRYRTTSLFRSASEVHAYAVTDGTIALQRNPANNAAVNLILKPKSQPIQGLTPVRYFVYRGLRLDEFLEGTSGVAAKRVRARTGSSPFIDLVWDTFLDLNPGETEVPATFLGYDADAPDTTLLDDLFFRLDPNMQLQYVREGMDLGRFHIDGGLYDFGFEVMLHEGDYAPDLGYARKEVNEIAGGAPDTAARSSFSSPLAQRIEKEKILNFLDVAAFYGLHMHEGGIVRTPPGASPPGPYTGQQIFTNIIDRSFAPKNKNRLYVDIRSDNGSSLNFHGNYDDGSGNQVQIGDATLITPKPYAADGWPILILERSAAVDTTEDTFQLFIQLRLDDNQNPVVFVDHGEQIAPNGAFIDVAQPAPSQWSKAVGLQHPNSGLAGAKVGVPWLFRLFYGRQEVAVRTVPLPAAVVPPLKYTDCVFGPIDRAIPWKHVAKLKWVNVQDNRYVDAKGAAGWRQMMQCGLAQETTGKSRSLFYAVATASNFSVVTDTGALAFAPIRSVPDGVSDRASFFAEPGLFGVYVLEHDEVVDGGTFVHTLRLLQNPKKGYPPSSALILGLSNDETDTLLGLGPGLSKEWQRTLVLDGKTTVTDANAHTFDRYRVGVQGLKTSDGTRDSAFPSIDIFVYTVDGQLFASKAFAADEIPSGDYARNYEEAMGERKWPARERHIDSVDTAANSIAIAHYDWRNEVFPGDRMKITKTDTTSDEYSVVSTTLSGDDTVIVLSGGPPVGPVASLVSAFTVERNVEDYFIGLDQSPSTDGIDRMRTLVDQFLSDLSSIDKDDSAAKSLILSKVNDIGPKILRRARKLAQQNPAHADDIERTLYWTRLRITVAVKSHPYCVKAFTDRNEILDALERKSRGYDLDFAGQPTDKAYLRVLLTGFDPFALHLDIATSNPAGAVALALHGQTIPSSGTPAYVETAIFPTRYRDFDAGRVETLVNRWLLPETPTPAEETTLAAAIISVSRQNAVSTDFDLERFAGRRRGGLADNEFVIQPPKQIGGDATYLPFFETTLKHDAMVLMPPPNPQLVFFDQGYTCKSPTGGPDIVVDHPGSTNTNRATQAPPAGEAVRGSGGSYLSNEIFYRIAHRRETLQSKTLTGHFHVPSTKASGLPIDKIIDEVRNLITRWLDNP